MKRILVIEDEPQMLLGLRDNLELEGYEVQTAGDGEEGLARASSFSPDLVILDVMLPKKNGFDVCRDLRGRGVQTPILMLTARGQVIDRVLGLKLGADDYLTKPFDMMELLARIEALLRRARAAAPNAATLLFGPVQVDFRSAVATRDGQPVELSSLELKLLRYFVDHRGAVVSREELLDKVWGYDATPVTRTVDVHVASLRQKLGAEIVLTVHGMGYKFVG